MTSSDKVIDPVITLLEAYKNTKALQLNIGEFLKEISSLKYDFDQLIAKSENCENQADQLKYESEFQEIQARLEKTQVLIDYYSKNQLDSCKIGSELILLYEERINKATETAKHKYNIKLKSINNLLAMCFGILILVNIAIPGIDTNFLVAFGATVTTIVSVLIYRKKAKTEHLKTISDIYALKKDIERMRVDQTEIEEAVVKLREEFIDSKKGAKND